MAFFRKKGSFLFLFCMLISGCSSQLNVDNKGFSKNEFIFEKTKNYKALVTLYRKKLSEQEDPAIRLKLAEAYYHVGDYASSLVFLHPLMKALSKSVLLLSAKNYFQLGKYEKAKYIVEEMLNRYPKNGEGFNLKGVILARIGNLKEAEKSFSQARYLFIDDEVAINNLAMIALLKKEYEKVVKLLLPIYTNGTKSTQIINNLIFSLIKKGDIIKAKEIIAAENLSKNSELLIANLKAVNTFWKP